MREELKANLTRPQTWLRGLFILLFAVLFGIGASLLLAVVIFQFVSTLFTGERNPRLLAFARALSVWLYQTMLYAGFNRDERPWPFDAWPTVEAPILYHERGGEEG